MIKTALFLLLALLCLANSLILTFRASATLGLYLMYALSAALFCYALFHTQVDAFCRHGVGAVLRAVFFCGVTFFIFLVLLMEGYALRCRPGGGPRVLIVLGAGLRGDAPSDTLRRRLDAALDYYRQNPGCLLVLSGGQGPDETVPEATAMARYLQAAGLPGGDLLIEDRSTSTEENFAFSLALLRQRGLDEKTPILFVTNSFHCYRAACYARRMGFSRVEALPTTTSPLTLLPALMREALAICALWAGIRV